MAVLRPGDVGSTVVSGGISQGMENNGGTADSYEQIRDRHVCLVAVPVAPSASTANTTSRGKRPVVTVAAFIVWCGRWTNSPKAFVSRTQDEPDLPLLPTHAQKLHSVPTSLVEYCHILCV